MSYLGIGIDDPNHPLEVDNGQVFISNVEQGSAKNEVPFEIHSDYTGITGDILEGARQFRLRVTPTLITPSSVNMDMGIEPTRGDYFYISNPVVDTPLGSNAAFRITQAGDVTMGNELSVTGNVTSNALQVGNVLYVDGQNITISYLDINFATTAFIDTQGHLWVKGQNSAGQLGLGYTGGSNLLNFTRTAINVPGSITHVAIGSFYILIIADGKVYGCGRRTRRSGYESRGGRQRQFSFTVFG